MTSRILQKAGLYSITEIVAMLEDNGVYLSPENIRARCRNYRYLQEQGDIPGRYQATLECEYEGTKAHTRYGITKKEYERFLEERLYILNHPQGKGRTAGLRMRYRK